MRRQIGYFAAVFVLALLEPRKPELLEDVIKSSEGDSPLNLELRRALIRLSPESFTTEQSAQAAGPDMFRQEDVADHKFIRAALPELLKKVSQKDRRQVMTTILSPSSPLIDGPIDKILKSKDWQFAIFQDFMRPSPNLVEAPKGRSRQP